MKLTTWLKWGTVILMTMVFMGGWVTTRIAGAQASTWHVATDGSDITGDGSEANPFATIQHGIDVASDGDTVLVHPGVYEENIDFVGKNITVGSLFVTTGDDDYVLRTVIDGNRNGHVVTFANGEDATARLSGFTITNGYANGTSPPGSRGGGVCCLDSSPTLTHLKVSGNEAAQEGGGLYFDRSSPIIQDVIVANNLAGTGAGGILYANASVSLENVIVAHNSARGGSGAGILFYHAEGTVTNALIADNSGVAKGGGLMFDGCSPTFINVTIVGNWTAGHGGGLNVSYMSQPTLVNSIVWGNSPEQIYFDTDWPGEAVTIEYSDIQGGEAGIVTNGQGPVYWLDGNMDASPRFVSVGLGNYHLADDSPCISGGKATGAPIIDLEGNPRPNPAGTPPDMGAYENPLGWSTVQFSSGAYSVAEGAEPALITVTLSAASPLTVTVAYSTTDGTAVAGSDYVTTTGTLTFTPGVISQTFNVPILDDAIDEPAETVSLTLSSPVQLVLGTPVTAVLTIVDDNDAPVAVDDTFTVAEDRPNNALDVLANDTDPELNPLAVSAVGVPDQGGTAISAGTHITYTPAPDFHGLETFTYTVSDGQGGYDTAAVTVIVTPNYRVYLPLVHKATNEPLRVGMVSNVAGMDDAGFNQNTWDGLQRAHTELGVQVQFIESQSQADYEPNIAEFAEQGYDLVVTVGFLMGDATANMAEVYSNTWMAIMDMSYDPPIPNVAGAVFSTDEAAFPAGYLAAGWAVLQDPTDPQVGFVGGMQIPPVEQFIVAYENGVEYYNDQHEGQDVLVKGVYVGDFESPYKGWIQGNSLIDEGVDVIFGVGGATGNGALTAAKERGKWGVGVDVDQYFTLPNEKDILLTSCMKRVDNAVFELVRQTLLGSFPGGGIYVGTLANGGVGLAPYHDLAGQIPNELDQGVQAVIAGIIAGEIDTGWPVP